MATVLIRTHRDILFIDINNDADCRPGLTTLKTVERGWPETKYTLEDTRANVDVSESAAKLLAEWPVADHEHVGSLLWRRDEAGLWQMVWYGDLGTLFVPWGEPFMAGTEISNDAFSVVHDQAPDWDMTHYAEEAYRQRAITEAAK